MIRRVTLGRYVFWALTSFCLGTAILAAVVMAIR